MTTSKIFALSLALMLAFVVARAETGHSEESPGDSGQPPAQKMNTPADDLEQAATYRDRARQARESAERHRTMAASYARRTKPLMSAQMEKHCANIIAMEERLADEFDGLAAIFEAEARK